MNIIAIVSAGIFYILGAALMWCICDESDPEDVERRPIYSIFWPFIVCFWLLSRVIDRGEE